jgi:hypothetical protein
VSKKIAAEHLIPYSQSAYLGESAYFKATELQNEMQLASAIAILIYRNAGGAYGCYRKGNEVGFETHNGKRYRIICIETTGD